MARILVVDDEPIIAMTIADWLGDLGHIALGPAANLASALSWLDEDVDAAILDVTLGAQTTILVAARLAERGAPFVVATGHAPEMMDGAFAQGLLLPKPFGFETFRCVVARLLCLAPH